MAFISDWFEVVSSLALIASNVKEAKFTRIQGESNLETYQQSNFIRDFSSKHFAVYYLLSF